MTETETEDPGQFTVFEADFQELIHLRNNFTPGKEGNMERLFVTPWNQLNVKTIRLF